MTGRRGRIRITGFDTGQEAARHPAGATDESDRRPTTRTRWRRAASRFRRDRSAMIGLGIVLAMVAIAVFARPITVLGTTVQPFALAPHDPEAILRLQEGHDVGRYAPPSLAHPMGTDEAGRDLLSRVMYGGRYSISIAVIVVVVSATVGMVYGGVAGYYGGWVDEVMMRIVDAAFAFPTLVLALVIIAMLGGGYWQLVAAFSLVGWVEYARIMRGEVLRVKRREYVLAARAIGASDRAVLARHVFPNAVTPLVVQASLSVGTVVIGVAALGFLGVGFDPGTAEWGTMLERTRHSLVRGPGAGVPWWATLCPGMAIFLFVLATNLVGDGLTDALDARGDETVPRGRGG